MLATQKPLVDGMSISLARVDELVIGRGTVRLVAPGSRKVTVMVDDDEMSRTHAALRRIVGAWLIEDLGSKNGTFVNGDLIRRKVVLNDGDVLELGATVLIFREAGSDTSRSGADANGESRAAGGGLAFFKTFLPSLESELHRLALICPTDVDVLVRGETGTGKELIARAIHKMSGRGGEFVAINCGALPMALLESELFGNVRGAFTGASAPRPGLVRSAHHGTLFLDEIGDLPLSAQTTLLRVLQERSVVPLGSAQPVPVDIRIIAATHRPLDDMIESGEFRRDLYARLAGFELTLPPLRERREDIGILVAAILRQIGLQADAVTIDRAAARALLGYHYPQNVRELQKALRSAVLLAQGKEIRLEHLPASIQRCRWPVDDATLEERFREKLLKLLHETKGNVAETGRILGKAPVQIRRWCKRFEIDIESFRRSGS